MGKQVQLDVLSASQCCSPGLIVRMRALRRMDIRVAAAPLAVVHYTVDLKNASCGLTLTAAETSYSGRMLLNQPAPGAVLPGMSAIARKRCFLQPPVLLQIVTTSAALSLPGEQGGSVAGCDSLAQHAHVEKSRLCNSCHGYAMHAVERLWSGVLCWLVLLYVCAGH